MINNIDIVFANYVLKNTKLSPLKSVGKTLFDKIILVSLNAKKIDDKTNKTAIASSLIPLKWII